MRPSEGTLSATSLFWAGFLEWEGDALECWTSERSGTHPRTVAEDQKQLCAVSWLSDLGGPPLWCTVQSRKQRNHLGRLRLVRTWWENQLPREVQGSGQWGSRVQREYTRRGDWGPWGWGCSCWFQGGEVMRREVWDPTPSPWFCASPWSLRVEAGGWGQNLSRTMSNFYHW